MLRRGVRLLVCIQAFCLGVVWVIGPSMAGSLEHAIRMALQSNPEIGAAIANREAIDFELEQANGLYLPSVDFLGRSGAQNRDSPATRPIGSDDDTLFRNEANVIVSQLLFDGWETRGEVERQAARVDGAAARILERSEFIALNVTRQYLEIGRLMRVVSFARQNIGYHKRVLNDIESGATGGAISVADKQQAEERVFAAEARLVEFTEELNNAHIRFRRLVGEPIGSFRSPRQFGARIPNSLGGSLALARANNPTLKITNADIDAATALIKKAESEFYPKVTLEGTARHGDDIDGIRGYETDLRAEVVVKWNLYRGGIDGANRQEQIRRVDEERYRLHQAHRDVEEAVRLSWETRNKQRTRLSQLRGQLSRANQLIESYEEQFKIGARSLLDLLDTQNTRFSTQVAVETAHTSYIFAEYRMLASMGILLDSLGLTPPDQSTGLAREQVGSSPTPDAETQKRWDTRVVRGRSWDTFVRREEPVVSTKD